jgi:hypothetical protein
VTAPTYMQAVAFLAQLVGDTSSTDALAMQELEDSTATFTVATLWGKTENDVARSVINYRKRAARELRMQGGIK